MALVLQKINGAVYVVAGIDKFFYFFEDAKATLATAAAANSGTFLAPVSLWFFAHHRFVAGVVGVLMLVSGLLQLINRRFVLWASVVQGLVLMHFLVFLHRGFPILWYVDGLFMVALFVIIRGRLGDDSKAGFGVAVPEESL